MIKRIRHKGLDRLYRTGDTRGLDAKQAGRLRVQLAALDRSDSPDGMNLPGWKLHPVKGERKGQWAVWVSGNWRLVFKFESGDRVIHVSGDAASNDYALERGKP